MQGGILVALERLVFVVDRCALYEGLYLGGDMNAATEQLESRLVSLYADILVYLSKCKRYYSHGTAGALS